MFFPYPYPMLPDPQTPPPPPKAPASAPPDRTSRAPDLLRATLLPILLAGGFIAANWDTARRYGIPVLDEYGWAYYSQVAFNRMFMQRTLAADPWKTRSWGDAYGYPNPNFAKFVMGFALHEWGMHLPIPRFLTRTPGLRFWELDSQQQMKIAAPYLPFIYKLRILCLLCAAACASVLFYIVRTLAGSPAAFLTCLAFIFDRHVRAEQWVVGTDFFLMLLSLIAIACMPAALRSMRANLAGGSRSMRIARMALVALALGCCSSCKLNGFAYTVVFLLAGLLSWAAIARRGAAQSRMPLAVVAACAGAYFVFTLQNPQYYPGSPAEMSKLLEEWKGIVGYQLEHMPWFALATPGARIAHLYDEAWSAAGLGIFWPAAAAQLTNLGLILTALRLIACVIRRTDPTSHICLFAWVTVIAFSTTAWLQLDWNRYYLPLIPVVCILQAVAAVAVLKLAARPLRHLLLRKTHPAASGSITTAVP